MKKKCSPLSFVLLISLLLPSQLIAGDYHSLQSIKTAVHQFVDAKINHYQHYTIKVRNLDSRLKLAKCSQPLELDNNNKTIKTGIISINVSCKGDHRWSLHNSVQITLYKYALTLNQALKRHTLILKQHTTLEKYSSNKLRQGYFTDYQQIKGQQTQRTLKAGIVLQPTHLTQPKLVKKGDQVSIIAHAAQVKIQMYGEALKSGYLGQQISVRNLNSKKVIKGTITAVGVVSIY